MTATEAKTATTNRQIYTHAAHSQPRKLPLQPLTARNSTLTHKKAQRHWETENRALKEANPILSAFQEQGISV
jgi:hypothetical protein